MSYLEQSFQSYLNMHPEIRALYTTQIINIRGLARDFLKEQGLGVKKIEAVVAMIRRFPITPLSASTNKKIFSDIKISLKDDIVILDYEKSKAIVEKIKEIVSFINYDRNETLKVVIGSHNVKIIVDSTTSSSVKQALGKNNLIKEYKNISEISLLFSSKALNEKGIVAYVTNELLINGLNIREILTCTPELIMYFDGDSSLKAYEIFKRMKQEL